MRHTIPHDLDHETARRVTKKALESYQKRFPDYNPSQTWIDDNCAKVQFTVANKTLQGSVVVTAEEIELDLAVPLIFRPFQKIALRTIEQEINTWLESAREDRA